MLDFFVSVNRVTADVLRWLADSLPVAPRQVQAAIGGLVCAMVLYWACGLVVGLLRRLHRRSSGRSLLEPPWVSDHVAGARRLKQLRREQPEASGLRPGASQTASHREGHR